MIVYNKLGTLLQSRGMTWSDLRGSGIAANTPFKFSTNKGVTVDSIDKVCKFLRVQPGDIMEWVENEDDLKKIELERQIAEMQKQLKALNNKTK